MVSGLDITVRECVFRHALRNASTSVILNFNHENTDLLEYLADRKIREELPSARFSPNEICNTYYRIENDELKYHVMCEAFRLLKDVSAELGTELNLETYRVLSEPEGFENALEILNSRGKIQPHLDHVTHDWRKFLTQQMCLLKPAHLSLKAEHSTILRPEERAIHQITQ